MEELIVVALILVLITWLLRRLARSVARISHTPTTTSVVSVSISADLPRSEIPKTGEPVPTPEGGWTLNPMATFTLTILGVDSDVAHELKQQLDQALSGTHYEASKAITPIIARSNLRCKEIDEYISKFKPVYLAKLEELKRDSPEWTEASAMDREDLLTSFKEQALNSLDVRPSCDLAVLLELEPQDSKVDDALIDRYGFEQIQLYLRYAGDLSRVRVIPADHRERKGFERLVEQGLVRRGADIPLTDILTTLKLQDLNRMLTEAGTKAVSRKAKAVDLLLDQPRIKDRLGEMISFRELFQLLPLPSEFAGTKFQQVADAWRYAGEIADLITHTYVMAGYATRDRNDYQRNALGLGIKGWQLSPARDACPFCQRAGQKIQARRPRLPLHIGCRCSVSPVI